MKEYINTEELLIDEHFLAWYFDPAGKSPQKWREWRQWMDADPARKAQLEEAVLLMQSLHLTEKSVPYRQTEIAARRLLQRVTAIDNQHQLHTGKESIFLFRNYLHVALRWLAKDKSFSFINIFGLALGLSVCLLIALFVMDEFSYDRFHSKAGRIYRLQGDISIHGNGADDIYTPGPMGPTLVKDYPQVQAFARLGWWHDILVKKGNVTVTESDAILADSSIFDVFDLPLITGNPRTALLYAHDIVIAESIAKKYFHSTSPEVLGQILHVNNETDYRITGIMKDMPSQSHFHANFLMAMAELKFNVPNDWLNNGFFTYVVMKPGATTATVDRCLSQLTSKYIVPRVQAFFHGRTDDLLDKNNRFHYYATPLTRIHLWSHCPSDRGSGSILYVYCFIIIAVFILLIACVNFMNLSTARSARRAKEVGIRKVLGSLRSGLIAQFLIESLLTSLLAMALALILATVLLPLFNQLADKHITISFLSKGWLLPWLAVTTVIIGLLAGLYPAFFLSAFLPVKVLKGQLAAGFRSGWLRNSLVVFQFTIAIVLIFGTLVIYHQLSYIRHKDLGYDRQQVLVIGNTYSLWIHAREFKQDVEKIPGVLGTTMTGFLPNNPGMGNNVFFKDRSLTAAQTILLTDWTVDANYIPTLGMTMLEGRNFSSQQPTDSSGVIINETARDLLGFKDLIGKNIYDKRDSGKVVAYHILGVVKDFHPGTLHSRIAPMMLNLGEERGALAIRIKTADISGLIARVEKAFRSWDKMSDQPFPYAFMDETFNNLYHADQQTGTLFLSFAAFAIFIGCLGLFGLVTYAAEQRTKEIGIRKVLGATAGNIAAMLSREFLQLILLATIIAFPIAWWGMNKWLQEFAYRISISWWIFAAASTTAILITLMTISFRTWQAARANPVKSLRTE